MAIKDWVINVIKDTKPPTQKGFGTILLLTTEGEHEYKKYDDIDDIRDDFEGKEVYEIAKRIFNQEPNPGELHIVGAATDIVETLANVKEDYYFVLTDSGDGDTLEEIADWIETKKKMFAFSTDDQDLIEIMSDKEYENTFAVRTDYPETYPAESLVGKCASTTPGSITWAYQELRGVRGSDFDINEALDVNANIILAQHGKLHSYEGKTFSGEYIDVIRSSHYLYARIDESVFNVLLKNGKVPYDNNGITMIEAAVEAPIKRAANNRMIAEEEGEFLYEVSAPRRSDTTVNDRAERFLPDVVAEVTLAGAIHKGSITIRVKI